MPRSYASEHEAKFAFNAHLYHRWRIIRDHMLRSKEEMERALPKMGETQRLDFFTSPPNGTCVCGITVTLGAPDILAGVQDLTAYATARMNEAKSEMDKVRNQFHMDDDLCQAIMIRMGKRGSKRGGEKRRMNILATPAEAITAGAAQEMHLIQAGVESVAGIQIPIFKQVEGPPPPRPAMKILRRPVEE